MITLEQFKRYVHFFESATIEEEIISSFSENDQICDMTDEEEQKISFKVDYDGISYFTFNSDFFQFKNSELISSTTYMIFVKLGENGKNVFGIAYEISENIEKRILNGDKSIEQKYFNIMFPKRQLNRMSEVH